MQALVTTGLLLALVAAEARSASAHHSPSMFDQQRDLTLRGVVTRIDWVNPHVSIHVEVRDTRGEPALWAVEAQSPRVMALFGWTPASLTRGDRVVISAHPLREGDSKAALGREVTKADGTTLRIPWQPAEIRDALRQ